MTDIVERLREYNSIPAVGSKLRIGKAIADAADEIERLREALSAMTELFKATESLAQYSLSEAKRLRVALERKQRPEAETIDGVIAWIKEDAERLAKARTALGEKE